MAIFILCTTWAFLLIYTLRLYLTRVHDGITDLRSMQSVNSFPFIFIFYRDDVLARILQCRLLETGYDIGLSHSLCHIPLSLCIVTGMSIRK